MLKAGSFALLGRNSNPGSNGGISIDYQYSSFYLSNSDDEIILIFVDRTVGPATDVEMDRVEYNGSWSVSAGVAKELSTNHQSTTSNNSAGNWCDATSTYSTPNLGTPGTANSCSL